MKSREKKYGGWAIVTGATSGIGRSFAHRIAEQGRNVVLVARTEEALRETADALRAEHGVDTRTVALDLSEPSAAEALDRRTLDLDVGLLVNNAAIEQRGAFVRHTPEELRRAVQLNVTSPTELGQRFGRRFVARRGGGIIFVAGIIGHQAVPHLASYAATKAHQLSLAEALFHELRPHGVDVLALSPGLTTTPMVHRLRQAIRFGRIGMLPLRPDRVARAGLRSLGRRPSIVAGVQYRFFAMLTKRVLSRAAGARLFGTLFRLAFADKTLLDPTRGPSAERARGGGDAGATTPPDLAVSSASPSRRVHRSSRKTTAPRE